MSSVLRAALLALAACTAAGCGPSPAPGAVESPSGTLVVVVRQGPDLVPFRPAVARIQRANEQLASILGRSIAIELDGSLLPQTKEGAEELIADLVEDLARDLDDLAKHDAGALAFARQRFERLVVRYAPAEAAAREGRGWRRSSNAVKLDVASKTIDVVRGEARWRALERGEIARAIVAASAGDLEARYARVLPDALPRAEHRAWFDYHVRGYLARGGPPAADRIGPIDPLRLRGMVMLHGLARGDAALSKDVREWLLRAMSDLSSTYHHHAAEVEQAAPSSPYRRAETAYVEWLRAELPQMTLDERAEVARHLWVFDFRKDGAERDRFASYAFPGIDPMRFSFEAVDAWIAAGHPTGARSTRPHAYFEHVVCPAVVETTSGGIRVSNPGRCDGTFYRWALADRDREATLVKGVLARGDVPFATAVFYNGRRHLRDEADYLRFLRSFERAPDLWRAGADVLRESVYRPSEALLAESRRLWREVPAARPYALLWFSRHAEGSYHPESEWPDLVQGSPADERTLGDLLALGWDGFGALPAAWAGVAKSGGRVRVVTARARALLDEEAKARPRESVAGTLVALARVLCDDGALPELAELRAFARSELAARPGAGLSRVVEATDPAECMPRRAPPRPKANPAAGSKPKPRPGELPPKNPDDRY